MSRRYRTSFIALAVGRADISMTNYATPAAGFNVLSGFCVIYCSGFAVVCGVLLGKRVCKNKLL